MILGQICKTMAHIPRCILRESEDLREALKKKWEGKAQSDIVREANAKGITFNQASLSLYINKGNVINSLTTEHLVRLCELYKINLKLKIK